jgi:hypothetical protein
MHRLPADWELHSLCYLAWAVHQEWQHGVNDVKRELAGLKQLPGTDDLYSVEGPRNCGLLERKMLCGLIVTLV